jgi:hypothetical protein
LPNRVTRSRNSSPRYALSPQSRRIPHWLSRRRRARRRSEGPLFRTMGRGTDKLTRSVLKRTEELRGHPPVDMEGPLSASAHSEVVGPRAGRGGTTSSNPLCSTGESVANREPPRHRILDERLPLRVIRASRSIPIPPKNSTPRLGYQSSIACELQVTHPQQARRRALHRDGRQDGRSRSAPSAKLHLSDPTTFATLAESVQH